MAEKLNVLFVQSQAGFGADSTIHAHLMRHLPRDEFAVHVACTAGDGESEPESLTRVKQIPDVRLRPTRFAPGFRDRSAGEILRSVRTAAGFPLDFLALRKYMQRENVRIVHSSERPRDAGYAVLLARIAGAKSVVHVHVKWSKQYSTFARWAVQQADAVFAISRYVESTLIDMDKPPEQIHTVLNCVDPRGWDPSANGGAFRSELGIPHDARLLVSVSRLFSWKGQRELVRAFAQVLKSVPDAWLAIVGADVTYIHGGSFTDELKVLTRELGVTERVLFTGPRSDIPCIMAACDVFTLPSFEEPFGLVFLEAMAMQRPVAALDNGGTPEVVEHGRSGLLSAPYDIDAYAKNVITLLEDPDLRARMGAYGRSRVVDYFNAERMARDAGAAYRAIVG